MLIAPTLFFACESPGSGDSASKSDSETTPDESPPDSEGGDSDSAPDSDSATDPTGATAPVGLWVWSPDIPGDATATADLFSFVQSHGVTTLFLTCDEVGYGSAGAVGRYSGFVEAAHGLGLEVYAMSGYSWFTVPCDAGLEGQDTCWEEGWSVYETCAASGVGFDGIMDDSEPASTPDGSFSTDFAQRAAWHVAYLQGIRDRIGGLPLQHATPAWYDDLEPLSLDGTSSATLDVWIAGVVDVVGVMAYRDSADEILALAAGELANGPAWVGVETGPSEEGDHTTFADDGAAALDAELAAMGATLGADPNFTGFMVDSYETWSALP